MMAYNPEERGHRQIHCREHRYRGWSDDTGGCPYCDPSTIPSDPDDEGVYERCRRGKHTKCPVTPHPAYERGLERCACDCHPPEEPNTEEEP